MKQSEEMSGGENDDLKKIIERYRPMVRRTAWLILRDEGLADDAAQVVFIRFVEASKRLASHPELGGWLHETARHVALQARRSADRRQIREQKFATEEQNKAEEENERFRIVDEALGRLSESDRGIIVARFFDDLSFRELGRQSGIAEDAARMRLTRAMERLREELSKTGCVLLPAALEKLLGRWVAGISAGLVSSAIWPPGSGPSLGHDKIRRALTRMAAVAVIGTALLVLWRSQQSPSPAADFVGVAKADSRFTETNGPARTNISVKAEGGPSEASVSGKSVVTQSGGSDEPEASIRRARDMLSRNEFEKARDLLIEITGRYPNSEWAYFFMGASHEGLDHLESAIEDFSRSIAAKPDFMLAWHGRARIQDLLKRYDEGIRDCEEALRLDPNFWPAHLVRGRCYYAQKRYAETIESMKETIRRQPDFGEPYDFLAWSYEKLGDYEGALGARRTYRDIKPGDSKANLHLARTLYQSGRYEECVPYFDKTLEIDPLEIEAWRLRGGAKKRLGRWREAIADSTDCLRMLPADAWSYRNRAYCRARLGEWDAALADADASLRQIPGNSDFIARRGGLLAVLGRSQEASNDLQKLSLTKIDISQLEPDALAEYYIGTENWEAAEGALSKAMTTPDGYFLTRRGLVRQMRGNFEAALEDFDAALKLNRETPAAWSGRAALLHQTGRTDEAIRIRDEAVTVNPRSAALRYERFEQRVIAGRMNEALDLATAPIGRVPADSIGRIYHPIPPPLGR